MDVNRPQGLKAISDRPARNSSDRGRKKDDSRDQDESFPSWSKDEAVSLAGALAGSLSLEAQNILKTLADAMEPLRVEIDRLSTRENYYREIAANHSFLSIPNRREFLRLLGYVMGHVGSSLPLPALLTVHISNASDFRRRHGLRAADHLLGHFAESLVTVVQSNDVVGNIGGENFGAILMTRSPEETLSKQATGIIEQLRVLPFKWLGQVYPLDMLVGGTELKENLSPEKALEAADQSLCENTFLQ